MKSAILAALILAAAPIAANAQSTGQTAGTAQGPIPMREPNLANPQAQSNESAQPGNAQSNQGLGQANSIPTPTLNHSMTPTNNAPAPH